MSQVIHYLKDYQEPNHLVPKIDLTFDIYPEHTLVTAQLTIEPQQCHTPLVLQGDAELVALYLNGQQISKQAYTLVDDTLTIAQIPTHTFQLTIETRLYPHTNKTLNGLYESNGNFYTQCEPEGFRKITYHPDRPDVMGIFTTKIIADKQRFPVLLSNGNKINTGTLPENRHWVQWHDPFAKPTYLFALVAGNLAVSTDEFITQSGKKVAIEFYTQANDINKVNFAIAALKHAMRWDENRFNLEYDLDTYMIVAVSDFNMGAMENKGLNIFNTKYVLADSQTATDKDFEGVESVIGHEYFHNWTGNRVTCRDWFQLSLKEGLTVFRDQEFSADRAKSAFQAATNHLDNSTDVLRIENVALLRAHQFPEDAGPMAHPIRPASYVEMNNFYTMTVYEKGAEVVRMYHTLLGESGFQKGMQCYFARHDGQAVTCDDFLAAMADANHIDLKPFSLWYSQAGTPIIDISGSLDSQGNYHLHIKQTIPPTPDMAEKQAMMIPIKVALFAKQPEQQGQPTPFQFNGKTQKETVLLLTQPEQTFLLENVQQDIVPSLLRSFSAPVQLNYNYHDEELSLLLAHDNDSFARWEAGQTLFRRAILANEIALQNQQPLPTHAHLLKAITYVLNAPLDPAFKATLLSIPTEAELWSDKHTINPLQIHQAREALLNLIAKEFYDTFHKLNQQMQQQEEQAPIHQRYEYSPSQASYRRLRNLCRSYILRANPQYIQHVYQHYTQMAHNMTHEWGILSAINHNPAPERDQLLQQFAQKFAQQDLVMDKYFTLIASSHRPDTPKQVQAALTHSAFQAQNPNKNRALIGTFARNIPHFHAEDGSGYHFLAQKIQEIDRFNPQLAAALTRTAFSLCQRLEAQRRILMTKQLQSLADWQHLSKDTRELVEKILA